MRQGDKFRAVINDYFYEGFIINVDENKLTLIADSWGWGNQFYIDVTGLIITEEKSDSVIFVKDSIQGGMSIKYLVILPQKSTRTRRIENIFK